MKFLALVVVWCVLFVLSWPVALTVLVLFPLVWLIALPFRLVGICVGAMFALGAVTYQVNRRLVLDSGMRFGLTHDTPRAGFFAGMTVGLANLYRRHHVGG